MHLFDIVFAVIALLFLISGIRHGFISEIFRLIALVTGLILAFVYDKDAYEKIRFLHSLPHPSGAVLSFLLVYVCVAVLIICLGWVLRKIVKMSLLGWLDKLAGGLLGLAKAGIIIWAACLTASSFSSSGLYKSMHKSASYRYYERLPAPLKADALKTARARIKKMLGKDAPQRIETVKKQISSFTAKIDSAKEHAK